MQRIMTTNTGQGYQSCLEPATGVEPAYPAWKADGLPLTYAGVVPVSPGCQAAASVFALTPMTSGCPASVFPSGFAVSQGLAPCGPTSGHGYAPCGRWRYSLRKASRFSQLKTIKKLPRPSALIFTSAAPRPTRIAHCSALGLVAGFRPPRPRLSGESRKKNYMRLAGSSRPGRA